MLSTSAHCCWLPDCGVAAVMDGTLELIHSFTYLVHMCVHVHVTALA